MSESLDGTEFVDVSALAESYAREICHIDRVVAGRLTAAAIVSHEGIFEMSFGPIGTDQNLKDEVLVRRGDFIRGVGLDVITPPGKLLIERKHTLQRLLSEALHGIK